MREFDSTFDKKMFEFAISGFIKSISFAINEIKIVEIAFNGLFVFIIAVSEYNDVIFFDCEQATLFVYNVVNNQIEIDCI